MATIPVLYGVGGRQPVTGCGRPCRDGARLGSPSARLPSPGSGGLILLGAATCLILRGKSPTAAMRALPLIHATLIVYAAAIIAATVL